MSGRIWLLTIPHASWNPILPDGCAYIKGQAEEGTETGYKHWQVLVWFGRTVRLSAVKKVFGRQCHAELSKSSAADAYVWKEESRIDGTQFELGQQPTKRNSKRDWDLIKQQVIEGKLEEVPSDLFVRHYGNLRRIAADYSKPLAIERTVYVYWGSTGVGKSRKAWDEAGLDSYPKDPLSKFWDGYQGQENVVIDEFRGVVNISHILRWFDRYPVNVEIKGSSTTLKAQRIWITSNLHPKDWYPDLDPLTMDALLRRLNITKINAPL